ncbi:MAG: hypothetical protein GY951_11325, partial [Psychromonas sp.]|nr:hypothetical protein [Psychromonas sp.]
VQDLQGGDQNDLFVLAQGGTISGNMFGNAGDNTVQRTNTTGSNAWLLTGQHMGSINAASFTDIQALIGSDVVDTLTGHNQVNTWDINSTDAGSVLLMGASSAEGVNFSNMENITGGNAVDTFELASIKHISGLIDGGEGGDILTLSTEGKTIDLQASDLIVNIGSDIYRVENVTSNEAGSTLVANSGDNSWNVTAENTGSVVDSDGLIVNFTNFENITGSETADSITVTGSGAITGLVDGAGGDDSLTLKVAVDQIVELGDSINENMNVINVESIVANSFMKNTLIADDVNNTWLLGSTNGNEISFEGMTTSFSHFENLTGGSKVDSFTVESGDFSLVDMSAGDDTLVISGGHIAQVMGGTGNDSFTLQGGSIGLISGGSGNDNVTYATDNAAVKISENITGIEYITSLNNNGIITGQDGLENNWFITAENSGAIADDSTENTLLSFIGFNTINGGSGVDNFIVTEKGAVTGSINGNGGDDSLSVDINSDYRTQSATINFDGGDGNDIVTITTAATSANQFDETYNPNVLVNSEQFDQLSFAKVDSDITVAVNFRDVATVNDTTETNSLTVNSSGTNDTLYLSRTDIGADSANVNISMDSLSKGDITAQAFDNGSLQLSDSIGVNGDFTITANSVSQTQGAIKAGRLILDGTVNVGVDNAIVTNVAELQVFNHSGEAYISQQGSLVLGAINDSTGLIDITALDSVISSENDLNLAGDLTLNASEIALSGFNNLAGKLDLTAYDIAINNDAITNLVGIKANNVTVTSSGDINSTGDIDISANGNGSATLISSEGDVLLAGTNTIDSVTIDAAKNIEITNLTAGKFVAESQSGDIIGSGTINVSQDFDDISATFIANNGDVSLLDASNDFNRISITANNADIVDSNDIIVLDSQLVNSLSVDVQDDISVGSITAGESIYLNSELGSILSEQSDLTATEITLRAITGIGEGDYDNLISESADMSGAINMHTANLSAINTTSGIVNLKNDQAVTITDLRNHGDIVLNNIGDILLQVTSIDGTEESQGAIDANYGESIDSKVYAGSVSLLSSAENSIYTSASRGDKVIPDIIAENLRVQTVTNFGTFTHPIRLRVNEEFRFLGVSPFVTYYLHDPREINSSANITVISSVNGLSGLQLIEVESLSDIDPAIFADVRNYNVDDVSVYLPRDQRVGEYEYEEEEVDEEEEF